MKREYPDQPLVGVGAIIIDGDRVAIVRRGAEPLKGEWAIPGGVLQVGESLRAGAEREALEETGLVVKAGEIVEVVERIVGGPASDASRAPIRYHYILIDFLCRVISGTPRAGDDAQDVRWILIDEIEQFRLAEPSAAVIRKAFKSS